MTTRDLTDVVIVIDKPLGVTSFDVVRRVRHATGVRRVGHGGTLDPLASGVLPVCVGEATKLAPFLLGADKAYDFTVRLGVETDTDDAAGAVTASHDARAIDDAAVRDVLPGFRGPIDQVPPAYSAIKRAGRPLYAHARAGAPVAVAARRVEVFALDIVGRPRPDEIAFAVRCSKGTYVRALARDIGRALGVGAHVTALRRTRSGPFSLADACALDAVVSAARAGAADAASVRPFSLAAALAHLDRRGVSADAARDLRIGRKLRWDAIADAAARAPLCLIDPGGALVAVAIERPDGGVKTLRVFGGGPTRNPSEPIDASAKV